MTKNVLLIERFRSRQRDADALRRQHGIGNPRMTVSLDTLVEWDAVQAEADRLCDEIVSRR
jgi:hypothetical protein